MPIGADSIISFNYTGAGNQKSSIEEIVKEKIKRLLLTNKGEVPNNLEYGADLQHFIGVPVDESMQLYIQNTIQVEVAATIPYVLIISVDVNTVSDGYLQIIVNYQLANNFKDSVALILGDNALEFGGTGQ